MDGYLIGHVHKALEMQNRCYCGCTKHPRWIYSGLPPQEPPGFQDVALQGWSVPSGGSSSQQGFQFSAGAICAVSSVFGREKENSPLLSLSAALWQPKKKVGQLCSANPSAFETL